MSSTNCATCGAERPMEELARVTLVVNFGMATHPFTVLMEKSCIKVLLTNLHKDYCPQNCEDTHSFEDDEDYAD